MRYAVGSVVSAAVLLVAGSAAPAHADHVAQIGDDERCAIGHYESPIPGIWLHGRVTSHVVDEGLSMSFVCQFKDLPRFVAAGERADHYYEEDWYAPRRATRTTVFCWGPQDDFAAPSTMGYGTFTMTPSGNGTLRCTLQVPPFDGF